jgi:transmembrane sensor
MTIEDTARLEATRWLILLQEQSGDRAVEAAFRSWLAASPAHEAAWAETSQLGALIAQSPPRHRDRWLRRRPAQRMRKMVATVAVLAVAAAIVIALMPNLLLRITADYATGTAQLRDVTLPDGSFVRLAANSALHVDYAAGERRVRLLAGSAFFEVEPDAMRPFRVSSGMIETIVLGTAFDVRLNDNGATVAVRHGAVRVQGAGFREQLGPGDWIRATVSAVEHGKEPADQAGAWVRGELVARDQPVGEVVDELRDYFHGTIIVTGDELAARRVTGVYALDDPAQTLRAIALTHRATLRQISPWVLVLSQD